MPSKKPLPEISDFPVEERTRAVELLLNICHQQQEQLALQAEEIQHLKDEISILKGEKGRPKITPSTLNDGAKNKGKDDQSGDTSQKRGKPSCKKTKMLAIHDEKIIEPENIPEGAEFKGYKDYVVQDIEIKLKNLKIRRAWYETADGRSIIGDLPVEFSGSHFGPTLQSYILNQYHQSHVPQNLILKQLREFGVRISAGQLSRIITDGHAEFHMEKEEVLKVGLEVSAYINVDDTGARHQGKNGFCTHIGNELFAWFRSTESKSRINFLELLQAGPRIYTIDDVARDYMQRQKLPKAQLELLSQDLTFADEALFLAYLNTLGIITARHQTIVTEGALAARLVNDGAFSHLVIVSDDAGQFNVAGFLNALCWVHAERTIKKLIPFTDQNRAAQDLVRSQIWNFYQDLKQYKRTPSADQKLLLTQCFDEIFTQKTCYQSLNLALKRIHKNRKELLLVLDRPELPLHNNLSENDIRDYVKKRKISATTRSDNGRDSRDTFLSLKKTCQKLKISFWSYLQDRIAKKFTIPPLQDLIRAAAQAP